MTEPSDNKDLIDLLAEHTYVPTLARGVSRCSCGEKFGGMPHLHRVHLAAVLAARDAEGQEVDVAGLCHWMQNRENVQHHQTHDEFHFGNTCPYAAIAVILRGHPDPREEVSSAPGVPGCGPHCGEDLPGATIHCRAECCHEKSAASVVDRQGLAKAVDEDRALFADIEHVTLGEPNPSEAADKIQNVFVAWLRDRQPEVESDRLAPLRELLTNIEQAMATGTTSMPTPNAWVKASATLRAFLEPEGRTK